MSVRDCIGQTDSVFLEHYLVNNLIKMAEATLMYDTRGSDDRATLLIVVVVSTVSRPMDTRAGLASTLIQKDTHDRITMRTDGT